MIEPADRSNAVWETRKFLFKMVADPEAPDFYRKQAFAFLKYFPNRDDMEVLAEALPDTWGDLK